MKNILRFGITAVAIIFVFNIFAVVETKAQTVNEILKRMDEHYKALKSLRANVTREKYNVQLDEIDKFSGSVSLIPGQGRNFSFRLDWTKPKEAIVVLNGKYVVYNEAAKTVYTGNSDSKTVKGKGGSVLKIFSMGKDEIKASYDVYYVGKENITGNIPTLHLKLVPKTKTSFKFYEMWVDGNGMPMMGKVTASNDDTDTILISKVEKNVKLNAAIFKIDYPKGTTVVAG